jgi:hypothetical protein
MMDRRIPVADQTIYSEKIPGDEGNWLWQMRFDKSTGGYIGITQYDDELSRVLLSPKQVRALLAFAKRRVPRG